MFVCVLERFRGCCSGEHVAPATGTNDTLAFPPPPPPAAERGTENSPGKKEPPGALPTIGGGVGVFELRSNSTLMTGYRS